MSASALGPTALLAVVLAAAPALAASAAAADPSVRSTAPVEATKANAPQVDVARKDYGLRARALAEGVWVVEGANADFTPANGCNIINTAFVSTGVGVLVINTGTSRLYGEQLRALIAQTTREPVVQVLHLNLHPDYFLGSQAFADVPRLATPVTREGMQREAKAYEDNLYRLCGDWMRGTEALLPDRDFPPADASTATPAAAGSKLPASGRFRIGTREFSFVELSGHTDSDLVLVDRASGIGFVGGLVFVDRIPTTPHAKIGPWIASLDRLAALGLKTMVPSHGPVVSGPRGIDDTRAYLQWIDREFATYARDGWEISEVLRAPVPQRFRDWAAFDTEYVRNVVHLYPLYERAALPEVGSGAR